MHLGFAVFWFVLGAALLLWPDNPLAFRWGGLNISGGWVALLFGFYNLARWWSIRSWRKARQAQAEAQAERERRHREEARREQGQGLDPNFLFTDRPPPEEPPPG
jgi:hypothetical protein